VTANFFGDAFPGSSFAPSLSNTLPIKVLKANPGFGVTSNLTATGFGNQVTLIARVSGVPGADNPQGAVQFFDSVNGGAATKIGLPIQLLPPSSNVNAPSDRGVAAAALPVMLSAGTHTISAVYSGDGNYNSVSAASASAINIGAGIELLPAGTTQATIAAGQTATYNLNLDAINGFSGPVSLACFGAPAGTACKITPSSATLGSPTTTVPVVVTVVPATQGHLLFPGFRTSPLAFAALCALALCGVRKRPLPRRVITCALALCLIATVSACGGGSTTVIPTPSPTPSPAPSPSPTPNPNGTASTIVVTGSGNGSTSSVALTLTITH
jgi:hypothetical protein